MADWRNAIFFYICGFHRVSERNSVHATGVKAELPIAGRKRRAGLLHKMAIST
jgi:hypothetical protein